MQNIICSIRSDVAYYDALGETILCVGLIRPKIGVFKSFIRYLLILATTIDIVILGVTFSSTADGKNVCGYFCMLSILIMFPKINV